MTKSNTNKLASWPIPKLLLSMGVPAFFSMFIQSMYNVVDTIYISNYSKDAMYAIGLVTPLFMIGLSIALGGATGIGTLVSRRLGEGKKEEAVNVASNGFTLALIHGFIVMCVGFLFSRPFLSLFTERMDIINLGSRYLYIVLGLSFFQQIGIYLERVMQNQGQVMVPMVSMLCGTITNIVLDPILIFGYFGLPSMGIAGAAIATVTSQYVTFLICLIFILKSKTIEVKPDFKRLKPTVQRIKDIYQVGIPTAIINMLGSVTTTCMNSILVKFSEDAVTALSLYFKLESFVFMPVFGFNQGALPIMSYNYGAQNRKRYMQCYKLYLFIAECILICGTLLFKFAPDLPLSLFETDASLLQTAEMVLRTISTGFIFAGFNIVLTTSFQSFGLGPLSMLQSMSRQLFILIPLAFILSSVSLNAVFYAYPVAEFAVTLIFAPVLIKQINKHLPKNA